ncbi:hypothetical protein Tco_1228629 [Tanacetum coccineum]
MSWFLRCSWCGGPFNGGNCRRCTNVSFGVEFVRNSDPISNDETPDFSYPPSQPQTSSLDQFHSFGCKDPLEDGPSRRFNIIYDYDDDDDDAEESTIPLNENISQIPLSISITPVLPIMEPKDSLSMGDEHLSTIPEKESDEFIKSSVEDLVLIPRTKSNDFINPLFDSNDDFILCDDESLSDEDVTKINVKNISNLLFEFDDEYISSDVNPLFDEVLEDIESEDSYVSKLDEPDLLVTPLSKLNEDECFDPGGDVDEIEILLHRDPSTP